MAELMLSGAVVLLAVLALCLTIKNRKKPELSVFLFLIAFENIGILAAGWLGILYGASAEMGNIR